eukprot:2013021-Alexandrium_andersonii.AAC.1
MLREAGPTAAGVGAQRGAAVAARSAVARPSPPWRRLRRPTASVGGQIPLDVFDDVDAEMDYLVGLLDSSSSSSSSPPVNPALDEAPDFIRALFAAGATPGEVRASVAEVFSPPR